MCIIKQLLNEIYQQFLIKYDAQTKLYDPGTLLPMMPALPADSLHNMMPNQLLRKPMELFFFQSFSKSTFSMTILNYIN